MRSSHAVLLFFMLYRGAADNSAAGVEVDLGSGGAVRMDASSSTAAVLPTENPYTVAGDATAECYTWAADGQCRVNPGYMLTSCKYSCWEWFDFRSRKYPDAPIDKKFECHSWSERGECHKNPAYMRTACPETCEDRYDPPEPPPPPPSSRKTKKRKRKKTKDANPESSKDEL